MKIEAITTRGDGARWLGENYINFSRLVWERLDEEVERWGLERKDDCLGDIGIHRKKGGIID
ncbi:MAG: hypothetical protein BTN85_0550 [Candidatus Methanohalarchaeum thermophilum]|uniref:Uncharacterized protein n=1 Tax=Methanohalarchaeum thermophilum TaxID=1903181 RepID=A0A1Q6DUN9_METT1|nr:MAG: hypothetical protein BTN85_0270 [Candidatus Methanohalarchaeum thermophilum]OKY78065.1 MAG: hypothetical protein BTN85_0550 [Candidatus Methanohalarchaeum thermophilum]